MSAFKVAIGGKADMTFCTAHVRFWPKADMPSRFMVSATGELGAPPERLAGLAINVRFGERKLAQFNIIEH